MVTLIQEPFNIIYYLWRRGHENLQRMKVMTFGMATDPDNNLQFIFQRKEEANKNHSGVDTNFTNQDRIYKVPGKVKNTIFPYY